MPELKKGPKVEVKIVRGDISKQETDAVVCPHNPGFAPFSGSPLQRAVFTRGGEGIKRSFNAERKKLFDETEEEEPDFPVGHSILTEGGGLPNRKVIHVVATGINEEGGYYADKEVVKGAIQGALRKAHENQLRKVSIPAIGTGVYGLPIKENLKGSLEAIKEYIKKNPNTNISHIRLVYYSPREFDEAVNACEGLSQRDIESSPFTLEYVKPIKNIEWDPDSE